MHVILAAVLVELGALRQVLVPCARLLPAVVKGFGACCCDAVELPGAIAVRLIWGSTCCC